MDDFSKIITVIKDEIMGSVKRARLYRKIIKSLKKTDFHLYRGIDPAFDEALDNIDKKQKESED
jgi:hypothetical protein